MDHYYNDDAEYFAHIIRSEWDDIKVTRPDLYVGGFDEISAYNFSENGTAGIRIQIRAETVTNIPKGISYDFQERRKMITFDIATINREKMIKASDELDRIMTKYRIRPGNNWDQINMGTDTNIYPSHKFYRREISMELVDWMHPLPKYIYSENKVTKS